LKGYLNLEISDPGKRVFETPARQVTLVGLWEKKLPDPGRFLGLPARQAIQLLAGYEIDGCCFVVEKDTEETVAEIFAYRGPATAHEVYFAAGQNGNWILSNMFRSVLGSLPLNRRDVSPEGFLFLRARSGRSGAWGTETCSALTGEERRGSPPCPDWKFPALLRISGTVRT